MNSTLNDRSNSSKLIAGALSMIAGVNKHLSKVPSFTVAGKAYTPSEVVAVYQSWVDALNAAIAARGAWLAAVGHLNDVKSSTKPFVSGFHQMVMGMFSTEVDTLADFALVPRKRTAPKIETMAVALQKNKATRIARKTVGPKAKLKIHGSVNESGSGSTTSGSSGSNTPK